MRVRGILMRPLFQLYYREIDAANQKIETLRAKPALYSQ